ncbi:MAG: hypothetical protein EBS29_12915 [Chloroflexia bacterium]|nr:hypothetical protein [Chloroflexia bacterium]
MVAHGSIQQPIELPEAPPNVRFEFHPNGCYDWGTIGWLLQNRPVNLWKYKYFIFLNSSVRGPYIPAYAKVHTLGAGESTWALQCNQTQNKLRWQQLLVGKLNDKVKLVGATISCEGSPFEGNVEGEWRTNPHVQSYVLATDQVGL